MEHTSFHQRGNYGIKSSSNHSQQIKTINSSSNYLRSDQSSKSKEKLSAQRPTQHKQQQPSLNANPSMTSLTLAQTQRITNNQPVKAKVKHPSQLSNDFKHQGMNPGKGLVNIVSSTGGHSFLRLNNNLASQNSNISNNLNSNASLHDHSASQISSLRKSPTATQVFNQELIRKPSFGTLKPNAMLTQQMHRPASGRPRNNPITSGKQQSFDKSNSKHLLHSVEQISINLHSNSQSITSSAARGDQQHRYLQNSQRAKMLQQISNQAANMQFSKTLRGFQNHRSVLSDEDIQQKEEQLSIIHKELKNKSIEILTDQLMLKDKEIQTMKRQMDIMRDQLIQQQKYIDTLSRDRMPSQDVIEERKSDDGISFDDSSLRVIEQKENPYLELQQKQLKRSQGKHMGSHQTLPVKGLVKCGSSLMNNRLGKTKSTANLFGDFQSRLKNGENIHDYIMKQKQQEIPNLEDIIRESMIEASVGNTDRNQEDNVNQTVDSRLQNQDEKSLSLDQVEQSEKMLDELFSNRDTKFNMSELDRLVNGSQVFGYSNKKEMGPRESNHQLLGGMNDHLNSDSEEIFIGQAQPQIQNNYYGYEKRNSGKYICANQIIFDDLDSHHESQQINESRQFILRNDDSFTSKQTNEYLMDLMTKHQILNQDQLRASLPMTNQILDTDSPGSHKSHNRSGSNDTAKLSFSKDNEQDFDDVALATQLSGSSQRKKMGSPNSNIILNAQSMQSISELLKEVSPQNMNYMYSGMPSTLATTNGHIGEIKAMNLALKKKTIEFSSPPNVIQYKLDQNQKTQDKYEAQTKPEEVRGMTRQKSSGKMGTMAHGGMGIELQNKRLINQLKQVRK